jgi:polysaccharide pyruvyl transferase CsaB
MAGRRGVLICGYYGNYNLGDEAMLAGMIKLLREQQDNLLITVFSGNTQDTETRHSVRPVYYRSGQFKIRHKLTIFQNRYFILGGGDLLRDSVNSSVALRWLRPLQQAIQLRRRTFVLGISVGEIWREETKALIPRVLDQVDLLTVRDADSKIKLEKLGVRNTIHVMSDLALQLLPEISSQAIRPVDRPIQIGISIRPVNGRGRSIDLSVYSTFQQEMAAIADFLAENYGATVHFLPFQALKYGYHSSEDDYIGILDLLRYSRCSAQFVIHRYFESLQNLNQLISTLDLVIGMRLHSLILAAGLGVPVIAAEYDPKVRGFMEEIGQAEYSIPLGCFQHGRLLPMIEDILSDSLTARQDIKAGIKHYRKRMSGIQQALAQTLES